MTIKMGTVFRNIVPIFAFVILGTYGIEPPNFIDYSALNNRYLNESLLESAVIGFISGEDPEKTPVEYFIFGEGAEYFDVDRFSGRVLLKKVLDFDSRNDPEISMTLQLVDGDLDKKSVQARVYVDDDNDEKPVFADTAISRQISEGSNVGLEIAEIYVTDRDTVNEKLSVTCVADTTKLRDACETFGLRFRNIDISDEYWRGKIYLNKPVDYERRTGYVIRLRAWDGVNFEIVEVHIELLDVNDTPPKWVLSEDVTIKEELPTGSRITAVSAVDQDTAEPRQIRYEIVGANAVTFAVDAVSGEIHPIRRIDFDTENVQGELVYDVTIMASEVVSMSPLQLGNDSSNTAFTDIRITVQDIDDNPPIFDKDLYDVSIKENIETRANIPGLQMTVTDKDLLTQFNTFDLLVDTNSDIFGIIPTQDAKSSSVTLFIKDSNLIDFETPPNEYTVQITARENRVIPALSGTTTVKIKVLDVNDIVPKFEKDIYYADVREDVGGSVFITKVQATDQDRDKFGTAGIQYQLYGDRSNVFTIDKETGVISSKDCNNAKNKHGIFPCIDYEKRKSYSLRVSATDDDGNGQTRSVEVNIVVLDVNDNAPQLEPSYIRFIFEESIVTVNPLVIDAKDPDTVGGPLTYSVTGDPGPFQVSSNGNITALRPVLYSDAPDPATGEVKFGVIVADKDYKQFTQVTITIIDINNNRPQFVQAEYEQFIPENTTGRVFIQEIAATDGDAPTTGNGQLEFDIISGAQGKFTVENVRNDNNVWRANVFTTGDATFDFQTQKVYEMVLAARDQGTPSSQTGTAKLTVYITDINNNAPQITPPSSSIAVSENERVGTVVHTVSAADPDEDSVLRYYFEATGARTPFGEVVNQNVYDYTKLFALNNVTGVVTVNSPLNRDSASFITYRLLVEDINGALKQTGTGALFITILEYNDQSPQFERKLYDLEIDEELNRNYFVQNLRCTDADDKISGYAITQTIPSFPDYFALIDNSGGMIVNNRIDYEKVQYIELQGTCEDTGNPRLANTTTIKVKIINVNDNSPEFDRPLYQRSLPERTVEGTYVVTVSATDIDLEDFGVVRYKMADPSIPFSIDPVNGSITVGNASFDRESSSSYSFQVIAYDSPNNLNKSRETQVPVYITIIDINDNCPIFREDLYTGTIPESAPTGTDIIDVIAEDKDSGPNSAIRFSITPGSGNPSEAEALFTINSRSGRIQTQDILKKKAGTYNFNVTAIDMNGQSPVPPACASQVPIRIEVTESENNPPKWIRPDRRDLVIYVLESQYEGMLVYNSKAVDTDKGLPGLVDYFFVVGDEQVSKTAEFRINQITGVIRAEIEYDREQVDTYFLTLMAKDKGTPAASSKTTITVVILDVNDNDPIFPIRDGVVIPLELPENPLKEDVAPGVNGILLGRCVASDLDSDHKNNRVYYELYAPDDLIQATIRVDRDSCEIRLIRQVDYEISGVLRFNIYAFNEKNDDSVKRSKRSMNPSILPVIVNIDNVNDNPPVFSQSKYMACAYVNTPFLQTIMLVSVTDLDGVSALSYSLEGTAAFQIDNTGAIRNRQSFFLASSTVHNFQVKASDNKYNSTADVTIFVIGPSNQVRIKQNRPRQDSFTSQAAARITEETPQIDFTCAQAEDYITDDGVASEYSSELLVAAVRINTAVTPNTYRVYSSSELLSILQAQGRDDFVDIKEEDDDEFSFSEDSVIAIFIICILLIIIALILFCLACYCIRDRKKKRTKTIKAKRHTIVQATEEQGSSFQNPVYYNQGYKPDEPEYASVKKSKPIEPVVIAAPQNLEPIDSQEPTELVPAPEPQPFLEPEPVIETEVMPAEELPSSTEPEYEDVIETTVVEADPVPSPEPSIVEDVIEVEFGEEPPAPQPLDDTIDVEIVDELPLPSPPPAETEFTIETSVQDS